MNLILSFLFQIIFCSSINRNYKKSTIDLKALSSDCANENELVDEENKSNDNNFTLFSNEEDISSNSTMDYLFLEEDYEGYGTSILDIQQQRNNSQKTPFNESDINLNFIEDVHPIPNNNREQSISANKKIPVTLFQHLHPVYWWKPVSEKINKIVAVLKHPNDIFGSHYIWKKLMEKNEELWSGANSAIYGLGHQGIQDYPFAYRSGVRRNFSNFK